MACVPRVEEVVPLAQRWECSPVPDGENQEHGMREGKQERSEIPILKGKGEGDKGDKETK